MLGCGFRFNHLLKTKVLRAARASNQLSNCQITTNPIRLLRVQVKIIASQKWTQWVSYDQVSRNKIASYGIAWRIIQISRNSSARLHNSLFSKVTFKGDWGIALWNQKSKSLRQSIRVLKKRNQPMSLIKLGEWLRLTNQIFKKLFRRDCFEKMRQRYWRLLNNRRSIAVLRTLRSLTNIWINNKSRSISLSNITRNKNRNHQKCKRIEMKRK